MLKAVNLSYSVGHRFLVKNLFFQFAQGAIHGLLGPNGSGKSTLLKLLTGIWRPSEGTVLWHDEKLLDKSRLEISKRISFVPQNPHIPFDFTVEQFMEMGLYAQNSSLNKSQRIDKIAHALNSVEALPFRAESINALSQGERQRIYIARAYITGAPILAFDEPTANLDIKYQKLIWKLLKMLAAQNKTVIISNHDFHACQVHCDFAHVLQGGEAVASGPYAEVMTPSLYNALGF